MPLLQFDVTGELTADEKQSFAASVADLYAEHMETTTGHVAVTIRERDSADLWLGRAVDGRRLFLDAEIREGRPFEQKRAFALAVMDLAGERLDVPEPNAKVVFTEHEGPQMMGYDRVGGEWSPDEGDGAD